MHRCHPWHMRLSACAELPAALHPHAGRGAELVAILFPRGLRPLNLPFAEEWAEVDGLLQRIEADGLARDIDRIAGPEYLAAVRTSFADYGAALGITKKAADTAQVLVADTLRALGRAMAAYATQVVAGIEDSEGEARSALRAALAPFDAHRAALNRRKDSPDAPPAEDPEAPLPPAPSA